MGYIYIHKIFYLNSSRKSIDIHTETDSTEIYRFSKTNANDSENTHFFTSKPYINPEIFFQGKNFWDDIVGHGILYGVFKFR